MAGEVEVIGGGGGEEEVAEYESDPEEAKMSLKMRRREASDEEEEVEEEDDVEERDGGGGGGEVGGLHRSRSGTVDSDVESEGGAAEYDDEDEEEEEEEEEEYYEEEEEYAEVEEREEVGGKVGGEGGGEAREGEGEGKEEGEGEGEGEGEKKEVEPFSVPTSGAFYMHDDRFRDNAGGRNRRTFGGRKLWESKDDRKWGHDKFEELNVPERHYDEGRRSSRGNYRGRGRGRGTGSGYARGNRMRGYSGNDNQNAAPKEVRGRGPRRYQPAMKNRNDTRPAQYKQSARSLDKSSHTGSGRNAASTANQNLEHEQIAAKKVASNLNSASPPFYPSGSSNNDSALTLKKEVPAGNQNRNVRASAVDHNISMPVSSSYMRGKNIVDAGMNKLHISDSVSGPAGKPFSSVHVPTSAPSSFSPIHLTHSRGQGRGVPSSGSAMFQPPQTNNHVNKVPPQVAQASQRSPVHSRGQPPLQSSGQLVAQRPLGGSQSSPPKAGLLTNTFEPGKLESPPDSGNSKIAVTGKGKGAVQGTGRGSIVYGGGQVMGSGGNMGAGHGDPNMPAFFPVMQFGGQHPGGMGVPAVGMAFPGYVAQPNGLGNSEMTWLPVLASAAGALGGYPPYLTVDGNYHPRPSGQASALPAPGKDNNLSKPNNDSKPQQRSDVANDEFSQRQNKPRRYSEMSFSQ